MPEGDSMASEENRAPRHGRHAAAGRHAAPRIEEPELAAEETAAAQAEASQAAVAPQATSQAAAPEAPTPQAATRQTATRRAHAARASAPAATAASSAAPVPEPVPAPTPAPTPVVAPAPASASAIPDLVSITDGDQETSTTDAPRPIGVDPMETGSFRRIDATEGARVTTRANASQTASFRAQNARPAEKVRMSTAGRPKVEHRDVEVQSNKRVFVALTIGAIVVIAIVGTLLVRALVSVEEAGEKPVVEQMQTNVDEGIEYRGTTYALTKQDNGSYALTSLSEGSETPAVVCELKGTPVALVLYNTVFVIPENLPDGTWDLIAHPLGGGSVTQQVTDGDGKPIVREGEITQASLSGDSILVTTAAGDEFTVSLI